MRRAIDILGNQAVWFIAVVGAGRGLAWPGVVAAMLFTAWHLAIADDRLRVLRLVAAAVLIGLVFDGLLARSGWLRYAAAPEGAFAVLAAPAWILALWVAFAPMLTVSLAPLQRRLPLAALVGAVGGPLAFLAAARGFDAVEFVVTVPQALAVLALGWAIAVPLLAWLARPFPRAALAAEPAR